MGMESLGGSMPPGQPVAVSSGRHSHVFAIAAGGGMNHWMSTDGGSWSGPVPLPGGNLAPSLPCTIALPDGSVHVFAISNDGSLMRWSSNDDMNWKFQIDPLAQIPGGWNGLAVASSNGIQIDIFAVATDGKIHHYSFIGAEAVPLPSYALPDLLPYSFPLPRRLLAAVSSALGKLDVFAVDPNLHMPLHWHHDGSSWSKHFVGVPGLHSNSGIAAVVTEPEHVELFGITADKKIWSCSVNGTTYIPKSLPAGSWPLPDGVPAVVAGSGGKLDLFAIGQGDSLKGGPLVHWRFNGKWSEPTAHDANLAAGGVTATRGTAGLDVFGFNAGTNNSLQHWPGGINVSARDPWNNWAGYRPTNLEGHCYPTCLEELVEIVRSAAQQNKRVRAVGSSWSFSDIAVTSGYVVETNKIDKLIPDTVVPNALLDTHAATHLTNTQSHHLVHVEAGIQVENLMTILDNTGRAPYTMGGSSGQTLAGVISTCLHGSHFRLPPFPDWVRAIHLIGPDGREHWIEPKDRPITDETKLQAALGSDVQIHYDDDWFDAALVTVGGFGIIYSVVLEVREQYKLTETITAMKWLSPLGLREQLADGRWFATTADAVQVAIDPGSMGGSDPDCYLSNRITVPLSTLTSGSSSFDPLAAFCEGDIIIDLLFLAAKELGRPEIIVPALLVVLPSIPAVVAVAALFPPVLAVLGLAATITATTAAAIPGLIALLKAAGPGAVGDVVGKVLDKHPELTALVLRELTKFAQPLGDRTNIAHQIMAPRFKGQCVARGRALEIAFDMGDQSHLRFLDAALAMLKEEAELGHMLGGYFAIRFVGRSRAILSPHRSAMTCTVEVVGLRTLSSTKPLLARLEAEGRKHGGIQHWGMFDDLNASDVAHAYPRLDTWRQVRWELTNGGAIHTFDNEFTIRCGLTPRPFPAIGPVRSGSAVALVRQTPGWASAPVAAANGDGSWNITNGAAPDFITDWAHQPGVTLVPGDFNGNGLTDIALVCQTPGAGAIPIAFAQGDGSWNITNGPAPGFITDWAHQSGVTLVPGDFNGNGLTDIALVCQTPGAGAIPIAFAQGDGSWNITNGPAPGFITDWAHQPGVRVVFGDFNGDGRTDIALVRQTPGWGSIPIAFAQGDGTWKITNGPAPDFITDWAHQPGMSLVAGDFNGNGLTDIALVCQHPGWASIPIAFAQGDGTWNITNEAAPNFITNWAHQPGVKLVAGDFNGNGRTDIALVRQTPGWGSIPIAFAQGDGTWDITNGPAPDFITDWAHQPGMTLVSGDFNADGRTDIALVCQTPGWSTLPIAFAKGDGSWSTTNEPAPNFITNWAHQPGVRLVSGNFAFQLVTIVKGSSIVFPSECTLLRTSIAQHEVQIATLTEQINAPVDPANLRVTAGLKIQRVVLQEELVTMQGRVAVLGCA